MILTRNSFFLLLFVVIISPFLLHKLVWLSGTGEATGRLYFIGHGNLGSVLGISTYPVIQFELGKDTIYFNGNVNVPLKEGETVSVRYQKNNPQDAKINVFSCIWGDTLAYSLGPFLIFLVVFFHPDLVPKKGKIALQKSKPWVRFLKA